MNSLRIDKRHNGVYLTCDRGMVAQMLAGYSQTQEEDARLLAAAPSLLAALKAASQSLTLLDPLGTHHDALAIDAALNQAEGRNEP